MLFGIALRPSEYRTVHVMLITCHRRNGNCIYNLSCYFFLLETVKLSILSVFCVLGARNTLNRRVLNVSVKEI